MISVSRRYHGHRRRSPFTFLFDLVPLLQISAPECCPTSVGSRWPSAIWRRSHNQLLAHSSTYFNVAFRRFWYFVKHSAQGMENSKARMDDLIPSRRSTLIQLYLTANTFTQFSFIWWSQVTETELQYNIPSPIFITRLNLEYYFEEKQIITAEM